MHRVIVYARDAGEGYNFESSEEARAQYNRVKKEILAGTQIFEISEKCKCEFYLVQHVVSVRLA